MTPADVDQIVEGIEEFIIDGNARVADLWQPYIDKLRALHRDRFRQLEADVVVLVLRRLQAMPLPEESPAEVCYQLGWYEALGAVAAALDVELAAPAPLVPAARQTPAGAPLTMTPEQRRSHP